MMLQVRDEFDGQEKNISLDAFNRHKSRYTILGGGIMDKIASGPTTDTVPAMLTPGEFVVNRSATQAYKPLLENLNKSVPPMPAQPSMPNMNASMEQTGGRVAMAGGGTVPGADMAGLEEESEDNPYIEKVIQKIQKKYGHSLPEQGTPEYYKWVADVQDTYENMRHKDHVESVSHNMRMLRRMPAEMRKQMNVAFDLKGNMVSLPSPSDKTTDLFAVASTPSTDDVNALPQVKMPPMNINARQGYAIGGEVAPNWSDINTNGTRSLTAKHLREAGLTLAEVQAGALATPTSNAPTPKTPVANIFQPLGAAPTRPGFSDEQNNLLNTLRMPVPTMAINPMARTARTQMGDIGSGMAALQNAQGMRTAGNFGGANTAFGNAVMQSTAERGSDTLLNALRQGATLEQAMNAEELAKAQGTYKLQADASGNLLDVLRSEDINKWTDEKGNWQTSVNTLANLANNPNVPPEIAGNALAEVLKANNIEADPAALTKMFADAQAGETSDLGLYATSIGISQTDVDNAMASDDPASALGALIASHFTSSSTGGSGSVVDKETGNTVKKNSDGTTTTTDTNGNTTITLADGTKLTQSESSLIESAYALGATADEIESVLSNPSAAGRTKALNNMVDEKTPDKDWVDNFAKQQPLADDLITELRNNNVSDEDIRDAASKLNPLARLTELRDSIFKFDGDVFNGDVLSGDAERILLDPKNKKYDSVLTQAVNRVMSNPNLLAGKSIMPDSAVYKKIAEEYGKKRTEAGLYPSILSCDEVRILAKGTLFVGPFGQLYLMDRWTDADGGRAIIKDPVDNSYWNFYKSGSRSRRSGA